jgi:farnesol dehydrogenase
MHRLTRAGARVRALARRPPHTLPAPLRDSAVTIVPGDLADGRALARLVEGAAVVYHLAGYAKPWARDPNTFARVNVRGTQAVCTACRAGGVGRLVHTSTNLVETGGDPARILTTYQRTKIEAEAVVGAFVAEGGDAVIVRPGRVYGPGRLTEANAVTKLVRQYMAGLFRFRLADGDARGSWVYVDDVVDGMVAAAARGTTGRAYTLGGENASLRDFLRVLADVTGGGRVVVPLPPALARGGAALMEALTIFGVAPPITREWVDLFLLDWPSDSEAAARDFGYRARGLREGLAATVAWLRTGRPLWPAP